MADAYYELIDQSASLGERFGATEYVRSAWDPTIQNGAPVSALLVCALERCNLVVHVHRIHKCGVVAKIQQAQLLRPRAVR